MSRLPTIYLVDDDFSARKGLAKLLTVAGYRVEAFSSSEDFNQIQSIDKDGCLIIDAWMSEVAGLAIETVLSRKNANIPIIFLSARDDVELRNSALAANAAGFFRKPIDGPALMDAIDWALKTHKRGVTSIERS